MLFRLFHVVDSKEHAKCAHRRFLSLALLVSLKGFLDISSIISRKSSERSFVNSTERSYETWMVPKKKSPLKMVFRMGREKEMAVSLAVCKTGLCWTLGRHPAS